MSDLKISEIVSFSSEDDFYKAENLLRDEPDKKWLCAKNQENKQFVVIKLEKPSEIRQIEITNASSAFIEILAGEANVDEEDFSVLLPIVSFMTPTESKNLVNTERLKIFTEETSLAKDTINKKWDRIKIFCVQSFNKSTQFGISMIKLYSQATNEVKLNAAKIQTGVFGLKKELSNSSDKSVDDGFKVGSVFQKWKQNEEAKPIEKEENLKKEIKKDKEIVTVSKYEVKVVKMHETDIPATSSKSTEEKKKNVFDKSNEKERVLKGVIFALSGFQNPLRSEIRDLGLKLGAKYRPDLTDDCTHLICAFLNTPKANDMKKIGGKIITKEWLYECDKKKKLLDADEFNLKASRKAAKNASKKLSKLNEDWSEDEEDAEDTDEDKDFIVDDDDVDDDDELSESESEEESIDSDDSEKVKKKTKSKSKKSPKKKSVKKKLKKNSESDLSSESEPNPKKSKKPSKNQTNDKISQALGSKKKEILYDDNDDHDENLKSEINKKAIKSPSSSSTEKNSDMDEIEDEKPKSNTHKNDNSWELPNFFEGKSFFIYGDFEKKREVLLKRMIIAFGGDVQDYMNDKINFVITDKNWCKEFEEAKEENKNIVIVNDDWLDACSRRKKLISHIPFQVDP